MINPQYGMLLNYFAGQTPPLPFGQNTPVRPVGPTGQTGAGAMVPFPSSSKPIVTIPPVQAASGRTGGNTLVAHCIPIMVPIETCIGCNLVSKLIAVCNITLLAHTHSRM
jgi:hypothetical protein